MLIKKAPMKTMAAGSFKGHCLAVTDEVRPRFPAENVGELKRFSWIRRLWCGWHSTRIGSRKRREQRSTMPARMERASPFATSRSWSWPRFSGRVASELKSALNHFSTKSRPGSSCFQPAVERARALGLLGGRGDVSAHCGPRDPQGAGGSNNLVSSYSTVTDFARFLG